MKKKHFILAATAIALMASCADESYVGDQNALDAANGEKAISFGFDVPAATRADNVGADAASALGNYFIVYGEKKETAQTKYEDGNLVFPNYTVHYGTNTAYTTTSNTKDWEYVGETPISTTNVKMNDGSSDETAPSEQTIKYWDYAAATYTFTAVSALKEDIENGRVVIQKNTVGADNVYQKGYTITLAKTGSDPYTYPVLNKLYFADRKVISQSAGTDRNASDAYGGNVTLRFRNLVSQIRAGLYETIPGYDITEIKFYVTGDSEAQVSSTSAFGAICPNTKTSNYEGTITVNYYTNSDGSLENQPKVTHSVSPAADLILGTNLSTISTSSVLGKSASSPTWETSGGTFTEVLPQIENNTNLKLKANYKLYNSVTHETINVTGATAEIPAEYLKWKPNYKYTYLFKISDNTNGSTGQDVTGLYPITFDAVEVVAEDGVAEYITTVSEPSITTFGVKDSKYVTGSSDYPASTDVYATVEDASSMPTLSASNMQLYTVTTSDATNFPITEASVAEALIEGPTWTKAQTDNKKITCTVSSFTYQNSVPAEDGTTKTLHATEDKAAKFTTAASTTYAIVYQKTAATYTTDGGKNDYTSESFTAAGMLYTDAECTSVAASWTDGITYYKRTAVSNKGVYAIKIVTVAP
ncbi:MAG: hypothetical protein IJ700_08765 [Bacteroidaceae bacterium]|nr:hypothetical protein [Bacteroidaceae bacterium]MBR1683422.1 hypothetical protein [Bacteroidaceae bacterium]